MAAHGAAMAVTALVATLQAAQDAPRYPETHEPDREET